MPNFRFLIPTIALAGAAACANPFESTYCTAEVRSSVVVEIRDARTGAGIAANARGVIRDGAFTDSLRPAEFLSQDTTTMFSRTAGMERPGTYSVEVVRPGYLPFRKDDVRVTRGECHVNTARVVALLQPAP